MNGLAPPFPPPAWQEFRSPDGRVYYYNAATKATQWTKPEELMSPAERALANQPWKEYTAEGGRKYWYNTETKQSSWEIPEVYKRALGATSTPTTPGLPSFPAIPTGPAAGFDHRDREPLGEARQLTFGSDHRAQSFVPAATEPEYATAEEAEAAFMKLLRQHRVQPEWSWPQTLRTIIKEPQFRAIKDPRERRQAFEKYCNEVVVQDKERVKERLVKLRADFATMLKSHPEIKYYTRWKTARPMIEGETIFRSTNDEDERRQLFYDYVADLKKAHVDEQATLRKSAVDGLADLLPQLNLETYTRWADVQGIVQATPQFQKEEKYKALHKIDILTAFQNHMKSLERAFNDSRQVEKNTRHRKERRNRDGYVALLTELREAGKIKAGTKWSQTYPLLENDSRYKAMLGQQGSTPLDLFWDIVEEEERALRGTRNDVLDVIDDKRFEVTGKTTLQEFASVLKDDRRTANIDRDIMALIFERLQEKKSKRPDEDKHADRHQRRAVEELRSYMKRLDPPIKIDETYEEVEARLMRSAEFQAVTSEEARKGAFDKFMRRLREKEDEAERDRQKRRERPSVDRGTHRDREKDRERDRDRGERSHRGGGRPARPSRTPEPDAYEADRRKAIAEREKNYRKSSMAETLLSEGRRPSEPHRDRDRERDRDKDRDRDRERDRERERDRDRDRLRDRDRDRDFDRRRDDYERERRDRDEERERQVRRREERRPVDELTYDERPAGRRRRAEDDDDYDRRDSRDSKRMRRTRSPRERTPPRNSRLSSRTPQQPAPPPKEELPGVHSGSEEGEIEED